MPTPLAATHARRRRTAMAAPLLLCLATLGSLPSSADAEPTVDLQIRAKDRVQSTLRPSAEEEQYRLFVPGGAAVSITARAKGRTGPVPRIVLLREDLSIAATADVRGRTARITGFRQDASELFLISVTTGGSPLDGDYDLSVRVRSPRRARTLSDSDLGPAAEATVTFGAPAGARVTLTATPSRGSDLEPELVDLSGPAPYETMVIPGDGRTARRHTATIASVGPSGDYTVRLRNAGASAGGWSLSTVIAPRRLPRGRIDIRDIVLQGEFAESQGVFGREVTSLGATLNPEGLNILEGTTVNVPAGAVALPTVISLAEVTNFFVDDDNSAGGPALRFEPAGSTFDPPLQVTLPFDAQAFDNPADDMTIFVQNQSTGILEEIVKPYQFDEIDGLDVVRFPVEHFSLFQTTSRKAPPLKGTFLEVELTGGPLVNFGGRVTIGLNDFRALAGQRSGNSVQRTVRERSVEWRQGATGNKPRIDFVQPLDREEDAIIDNKGTEDVDIGGGAGSFAKSLRRGRSRDLLLSPTTADDQVGGAIILRVAPGRPTLNTLAGRWHCFVYEYGAFGADGVASAITLQAVGVSGQVEFRADGTVRPLRMTRTTTTSKFPAGTWETTTQKRYRPAAGTLAASTKRAVLDMELGGDLGTVGPVELAPVLGGDVLLGVATDTVNASGDDPRDVIARLVVLVRVSEGVDSGLLNGRSLLSTFGISFVNRNSQPQGLRWESREVTRRHDGAREVRTNGTRSYTSHGSLGGGGSVNTSDVSGRKGYRIARDGAYTEDEPGLSGAVVPSGNAYFVVRFDEDFFGMGFGVLRKPDDQ